MPELVSVDALGRDSIAGQTAPENDTRRDMTPVTLTKLLEDQTQVLRHLVEKQGEVIESLAGLHGVLSRIDNRQAAADHTWQPIPQIPASSSSAWNPLYDSMMQKSITPAVDR
ncbi:uncharacterized protein STEHIDRAFT_132951 [Stereum hirsutum FP-91666 SS1]|uniref:uncharacterized protein n=1 Tax=Stereum hirsutum (strain FP-91666) TaxID=721885 RepID=UPI000444A1EE|nr:uncharacterized protein STEHIDRAFT_132951 [Stereum hirsutum FP-91666 SS1]EIM83830.1 hypothetical protein STEHIDRAFT_132951 [Stereum hirsutum FP-91666 SS1]